MNFSPAVAAIVITSCSNDGPRIASATREQGSLLRVRSALFAIWSQSDEENGRFVSDALALRPLEVALRRRQTPSLPDEVKIDLLRWTTPESLDLLRGTPINCLVVPWAAGLAEDEEQQNQLQPLLARASALELQVVGRVWPPADIKNSASRGHALGLSALALPSLPEATLAVPVIEWAERDKINWNASSTAVVLSDCVWPGIRGNAGRRAQR
jgi:hypothetical protein